ncbi:efflux RND transporter permease subunit [Sporosarcina limicola]|uniref:HAE1 family hydrophobic/amphiphilic exporter-1 n=1 Tax=Sporosarcina limicola TaxID=34101 RepID=A0A927MGD7_9BACL|nr:efflux RND transporter permease subunit [Sporosarcina limicola]MBE1554224.1 HAE1 family hydrophobic/amphiphilic exporter-1 [Sporosarcina limicola]
MITWAVKHSVAVTLLLLGIVVAGVLCIQKFNVELMPQIKDPMAYINSSYPNASAKEVDKTITEPLERMLKEDGDVKKVSSYSSKESSGINISFKSNVDIDKKILDLQKKISESKSTMPAGVQNIEISSISQQMGASPILGFSILGAKGDEAFLKNIEKEIAKIEGVAKVNLLGSKVREMQIQLDSQKLANNKLTITDVLNAFKKDPMQTIGNIKKGENNLQIIVPEEQYTVNNIEQTMITTAEGFIVSIQDIAEIKILSDEEKRQYTINDKPVVGFSVLKDSNANIVKVTDAVVEKIDALKGTLPKGIDIEIGENSGIFVKESIEQVTNNLILGGFLASAVLFFFFKNIRILAIITLSIPISVITALIVLYFSGQTLNVLSLAGLALGVGMMVDSSIVILENIIKYKQKGISIYEAVKQGSKELRPAVIASTLTTIIVFSPIFFIDDMMIKSIFLPFSLAVIFTLIASLIAALTIVPMLSYKWLGNEKVVIKKNAKWLRMLIFHYQRVLKWSLKKRWLTVIVTLALSFGSLFLIPIIGFEAKQVEDDGRLYISAYVMEKQSKDELMALVKQIDDAVMPFEKIINVKEKSIEEDYIFLAIQLVKKSERKETLKEIVAQIKKSLTPSQTIDMSVNGEPLRVFDMPWEDRIQVNLVGTDYVVLTALTEQVTLFMENTPGIGKINAPNVSGEPQLKLVVNKPLAAKYGLDREQIVTQMQEAVMKNEVTRFTENEVEYQVYLKYSDQQTDTVDFWQNMNLKTATGATIPLFAIASFEPTRGPISIEREDYKQKITISAVVADVERMGEITDEFNQMLEEIPFPPDHEYKLFDDFGAEEKEIVNKLILAIVAAVVLVYSVMAIQFNSYIQPIIIMLAIPPTFIGITMGLLLTGQPFSPIASIGVIILAGIVVNNSIILVDYINQHKEENWNRTKVIIAAGKERLRPILMTTLTTVLGMIPLAIGFGDGASMQQPIGIVTIFGLTVSTLFTLIFIPVVYTLFDDCSNFIKQFPKKIRKKANLFSKNKIDVEKT